jgi:nitrogen regulatory protein P-II 1
VKKLEALINPSTLRKVKAALTSDGIVGLTISEVRTAASSRRTEGYRSSRYSIDWSPRIKLELLVHDDDADYLIGVIRSAAREGHSTDESISVVPIQDVVRIRTGHRGSEAL